MNAAESDGPSGGLRRGSGNKNRRVLNSKKTDCQGKLKKIEACRPPLIKLTQPDLKNPFYALYEAERHRSGWTRLCTNFALLSNSSVQKVIIELLLKSRLMKDQFLTARSLLDFVYQTLTMKGYLFDNIFTAIDNEILEQLRSFDPSAIHTREIDEFILQFGLGIETSGYVDLKGKLVKIGITDISSARSFLRAIYMLKYDDSFINDYSQQLGKVRTSS